MSKVGVIIDKWKLETFNEVFAAHDVAYTQQPGPTDASLSLLVEVEDTWELQKVVMEANEKARALEKERASGLPVEVPENMTYELWSTETDRLLGTIELGNPPTHEVKAPVVVRLRRGTLEVGGRHYNAVQLKMCQMDNRDNDKRIIRRYWALETNLPDHLARQLEGFTPKIERPSLAQMFFLERHKSKLH